MKRLVFLSLSLLLLILVPGCFPFQTQAPNPTPAVGQPSVIGTFSSNPATINSGGTSTLLWNVTGANSVSIDQGIGQVAAAGTMSVSPTASTVYTISATNAAGTVTRSAMTTVDSATPLPAEALPFEVTDVIANIDPSTFTGACPKTFILSATITANGPDTITYRWERSDMAYSDVQSIIFNEAGTKTTTLQWDLGQTASGWYRIHVLTPRDTTSIPVNYKINCSSGSLGTDIIAGIDQYPYTGQVALYTTGQEAVSPSYTGPAPVNLGLAGNYAILAKSGISTTGTTSIVGDIGVSPIASTAITGFALVMNSSNQFAKSSPLSLVTGNIYAANYAVPTPAKMTSAISNMETAYTNAAGRTTPAPVIGRGAGNIGGLTLAPGIYKWSTGVNIPNSTNVTLSGGANDVWIFQIAQNLTVGSAARVILSGGAQAKNIFWQVSGSTTLGTTSVVNGNILCKTLIAMKSGARLNGRALAQTAVTLIASTIVKPAP